MKRLYIHGHIVPDGEREFLDGALLIEDGKILDIFGQSYKIHADEETEVIDASGKIILPAFFDPYTEECGPGTVRMIRRLLPGREEPVLHEGELGFHLERGVPFGENVLSVSSDHEDLVEAGKRKLKILLKAGYPLEDYDGFLPVLMEDHLDQRGDSVSAKALEGHEYAEVHGAVSERTLGILLRLIDRHKLIFCGGTYLYDAFCKAKRAGARWCDLVLYTSMNAYHLYGLERLYGGLKRGKRADYLLLDQEGKILETYREGRRS